jgi:hypothetical protein
MKFDTEQRRQLQNLLQHYETLREVSRELDRLPGGMYWKVVNSREYLYSYVTKAGVRQATSAGPRSPDTEAAHEEFQSRKDALKDRLAGIEARLASAAPVLRALNLPAVDEIAGRVLRTYDRLGYLGNRLLVVGTYAMSAYEVTAQSRFAAGVDATEDLDFTLVPANDGASDQDIPRQLLLALKQADTSFIVSPNSPSVAVNRGGYRVDLLMGATLAPTMAGAKPWKPENLPGQEWLLLGTPVRQVLIDFSGWPVPLAVPDPRCYALHKLWLAKQPARVRAGKSATDRAQGEALLAAVSADMPHYPLDGEFIAKLPAALREELQR